MGGVRFGKLTEQSAFVLVLTLSFPAMMLLGRALTLTALLLQGTPLFGWDDVGHMVVAQIALENLNGSSRNTATQLTRRVRLAERSYEFMTLACWMDDIKEFPMFEPIKEWHFINRRIIVSGRGPDAPAPPVNVQSILEWTVRKLGDQAASENVKAYTLAYLIHLVGDVHQPLHCATRYTQNHPTGDAGGNLFLLTNARRSNLHAFWDSAGGRFGFLDQTRPLNSLRRQRIRQFANEVMQAHPANSLPNLKDLQPLSWVEESHELARSEVYQGVAENGTPSGAYIAKAKAISGKRLAMAGYRLAKVINRLLGN